MFYVDNPSVSHDHAHFLVMRICRDCIDDLLLIGRCNDRNGFLKLCKKPVIEAPAIPYPVTAPVKRCPGDNNRINIIDPDFPVIGQD